MELHFQLLQAFLQKSYTLIESKNVRRIEKELNFIEVYHDNYIIIIHKIYLERSMMYDKDPLIEKNVFLFIDFLIKYF